MISICHIQKHTQNGSVILADGIIEKDRSMYTYLKQIDPARSMNLILKEIIMKAKNKTILDTQDEKIKCKECGNEFIFSVAEQQYFENLDFEKPKRCKECRQKRKVHFTTGSAGIDC